jgi:hypothetical protein
MYYASKQDIGHAPRKVRSCSKTRVRAGEERDRIEDKEMGYRTGRRWLMLHDRRWVILQER